MKKKSTSELAFFSLRVLPSIVAAAFIAFALIASHAVGQTPTCTPLVLGSSRTSPARDSVKIAPKNFERTP